MKKGYYWIPPVDETLNGMKFFEAKVVGDVKVDFKDGFAEFRLSRYFPVGSIFHFAHNKTEYVIKERVKTWGLKYRAVRSDGCKMKWGDYLRFTSGRSVYKKGEKY